MNLIIFYFIINTNEIKDNSNISSYESNFIDNNDKNNSSSKLKDNDYITFLFNGTKEIYLPVMPNYIFKEVIEKLKDKFNWIQNYDELKFYFNDKKNEENTTIEELGITKNDKIIIIGNLV